MDPSTSPIIDTTNAPITGTLTAPSDSLQGTILGQMMDTSQCSQCGSILSGANTVVQVAGYAEISLAAVFAGGELLGALGAGGDLAPTLETAQQYANAIGVQDTISVVPEITMNGEAQAGAALITQEGGEIFISQEAFVTEQELVKTIAEESMHISQQTALGGEAAGGGGVAALEAEAKAFSRLIWSMFQAGGGLP
jgi:hypothetical protein